MVLVVVVLVIMVGIFELVLYGVVICLKCLFIVSFISGFICGVVVGMVGFVSYLMVVLGLFISV